MNAPVLNACRRQRYPGRRPGGWILAMIALMGPAAPALAQTCDTRSAQVQFARDNLQRAAIEGDLASAQDFADRARREFDNLAGQATRCGCAPAVAKFAEAAAHIRRTQEAESRQALREIVVSARSLFEAALAVMQDCAKP